MSLAAAVSVHEPVIFFIAPSSYVNFEWFSS